MGSKKYHSYDKNTGEHYISDESEIRVSPDTNKHLALNFKAGKFYQLSNIYMWFYVKAKRKVNAENHDDLPVGIYPGDTYFEIVLISTTDDDVRFIITDAIMTLDGEFHDIHNGYPFDGVGLDRFVECNSTGFHELIGLIFSEELRVNYTFK